MNENGLKKATEIDGSEESSTLLQEEEDLQPEEDTENDQQEIPEEESDNIFTVYYYTYNTNGKVFDTQHLSFDSAKAHSDAMFKQYNRVEKIEIVEELQGKVIDRTMITRHDENP